MAEIGMRPAQTDNSPVSKNAVLLNKCAMTTH